MSTKTYSTKDIKRLLNIKGYKFIRQTGDHYIYKNVNGKTAVVSKDINKMVAQRLIKEHNLLD